MRDDTTFSLALLKEGNRAEIARLVDTYSPRIYRLGLKMLSNPQDAEDVLQNTFMKALQALPKFEGRSSLSTWLYRIAVNEALMSIRRSKPELDAVVPNEEDNVEEILLKSVTDWCCLPESELMSSEAKDHLDKAVKMLPEKLRLVFILRDLEGLSIRETSEALDVTETTVKTRLLRARLKLREALSAYYGERLTEQG